MGCATKRRLVLLEAKSIEPIAETAKPEPPTAKAPDISIYDAVQRGNIEAVKQHIAVGTDINAKSNTRSQYTPLFVAAFKGHREIAELLIANGADVHAKDMRGGTSLLIATMLGRTEVVELLISKGADVNAKDRLGRTPLILLLAVIDPNSPNSSENTEARRVIGLGAEESIHIAAKVGHLEAVKNHLAAGTNVEFEGERESNSLHYASMFGKEEIVKLLISHGADVNAKE